MHEMLDQAVGRFLPRHVLGARHVGQRLVYLAEGGRSRDVVGADARGLVAHMREIALVQNVGHVSSPEFRFVIPRESGESSPSARPVGRELDCPLSRAMTAEGSLRCIKGHIPGDYKSFGGRKSSWPGVASLGG